MMKRYKWNLLIILIFIVGLSVMLYPNISNYWNSQTQSKVVATYNETLDDIPKMDYDDMFKEAEAYNEALKNIDFPLRNFDLVEGYDDILNVSGTGIMGYITIEKINVELPIYHGTSEGILQTAVGHMQGSSLPTGGTGNHIVLSAHSGLSDAELFTNLDQMEEGDTFCISVLDRTLTYQVDQILVVEPQELEEIYMDAEHDYCTLVTCTPFGVNSHRLLVRGVRVEENTKTTSPLADAYQIDTDIVTFAIFIILLILTLLIRVLWRCIRGRKNKVKGEAQ